MNVNESLNRRQPEIGAIFTRVHLLHGIYTFESLMKEKRKIKKEKLMKCKHSDSARPG